MYFFFGQEICTFILLRKVELWWSTSYRFF